MRNHSFFLNLGQWFRRWCLEDFLSGALAVLLFGAAEPSMAIYAILKDGIKGNIHVKKYGT